MDRPPASRTVSREGSILRHPTPDLQSLQGAYISNVERLEQSAERLSLSSDIGEELRKMKLEQRRSESRRSSVLNSPIQEREIDPPLRRQFSYGNESHVSNSIVNLNDVARSGGFSPTAYFASPRGSVRSGSYSHHNSVKERSASYGTRLAQLTEPEQEGKPLDSPISPRFASMAQPESSDHPLRVMNNGQYNLDSVEIPHIQPEEAEVTDSIQDRRVSSDTYRQANTLFTDFDGVHIESHPQELVVDEDKVNSRSSRQPSMLARPKSYMEPTPGENMVYYPAPVPMMLNLPKRLSRLPVAPHRDKRRSELLGSLPAEARKSAAWLPDTLESADEDCHAPDDETAMQAKVSKRRTMADLPPQLRASMFFDYPATQQDVAVKGDSAVATLDSILDASAFAPVTAFTDHPFAGRIGAEVYGKTPARPRASVVPESDSLGRRRSTINLLTKRNSSSNILEDTKRRSSVNVLTKRPSSSNLLDETKKRNSSLLSLGNYFGKRKSSAQQFEDAEEYHEVEATDMHDKEAPPQHPHDDAVADEEADFHDAPEEIEEEQQGEMPTEEADGFVGQPTTLLAELQLRKEQQKQRTRTAATAFPNGMHSTLLQLDAVAQVEKQARKQKHTKLAWEDPNVHYPGAENEDDEDVPLGMLFPGRKPHINEKSRLFDEDRPLGLIAKREIEDNEPLSHRRARLRGEDPLARNQSFDQRRNTTYTLDLPNPFSETKDDTPKEEEEEEEEEETLAQRIRRLKATNIPSEPRPISGDFASEMLSQFGGLSPSEQPPKDEGPSARITTQTPDLEEETLGQRRKRLQAEAANNSRNVSGDSNGPTARPLMNQRRSMADILQAHPAAGAGIRSISNEIKFTPAPATRNTPWAINQTRKAFMGGMPMASGLGMPAPTNMVNGFANREGTFPNPVIMGMPMGRPSPVQVDARQRDMIDRWRQSVMH
ncbi:hypothetical protein MMC28_010184 [Mycoblastus sanguinarius]|nr:hypothetical protein [Mycoblastus sanguinarius]